MNIDTLRLMRDLLLRTFVIGFVFALLLCMVTVAGWNIWFELAGEWFQIDPSVLTPVVLRFFLNIRFFLLFVVLAPALAIHWTIKRETKKAKSKKAS